MPRDYQCPPVQSGASAKPKVDPLEKARAAGTGIIIDSSTGMEVKLKVETETNPLLRADSQLTPEEQLMAKMQNPPEVNPDFDSSKYTSLIGSGKQAEAEDMIKREGGPSVTHMQQGPLEALQRFPSLDPNWCDLKFHGCSLAQWACSMGYDEVLRELLHR